MKILFLLLLLLQSTVFSMLNPQKCTGKLLDFATWPSNILGECFLYEIDGGYRYSLLKKYTSKNIKFKLFMHLYASFRSNVNTKLRSIRIMKTALNREKKAYQDLSDDCSERYDFLFV